MQMELVDFWRMPMWTEMMNSLPAKVRIDLSSNSYAVTENRMRCVYADDLSEAEIDDLVYEWSLLFEPSFRRLFLKTLQWRAAQRLNRAGRMKSQFEGKLMDGRFVCVEAIYALYEKGLVAEYWFQEDRKQND